MLHNSHMKRRQYNTIINDLEKKMVFLVGPRQAGKTWLAKSIADDMPNSVYLNYDYIPDRQLIQDEAWQDTTELLILDELHKMPQWKNYLKGLFDTKATHLKILVTGSARLDVFKQAGDSLAGRYFTHRLMPLSLGELCYLNESYNLDRLLERGGFPEPLIADDVTAAKRWRRQYIDSLLREDVLNFDNIQNFKAIRLVFDLLRHRVGAPISYSSLAADIQISPNTVKKYIQILEALYIVFRVTPFTRNIARSLLKEPKLYFFDTGLVQNGEGAMLENLVAVSLYKHCCAVEDYQGDEASLHYLRTKEGKEVDFAVTINNKIQFIIEVKTSDKDISPSLRYFNQRYQFPAIQLVKTLRQGYLAKGIQVLKLENYLQELF